MNDTTRRKRIDELEAEEQFDRLAGTFSGRRSTDHANFNTRNEVRRLQALFIAHAREDRIKHQAMADQLDRTQAEVTQMREVLMTYNHVKWFGKLVAKAVVIAAAVVAVWAAVQQYFASKGGG